MAIGAALWRLLWPLRARFRGGWAVGDVFPDFVLPDLSGRGHALSDSGGRWTVLWFTNLCEDCRGRFPLLEELRREAGDRFRILAVSVLAPDDPLPRWVAPSCGFPILIDPDDAVGLQLGLAHPPGACPLFNLFIIDGTGRIAFKGHLSALAPERFRALWRGLAA